LNFQVFPCRDYIAPNNEYVKKLIEQLSPGASDDTVTHDDKAEETKSNSSQGREQALPVMDETLAETEFDFDELDLIDESDEED